MRVSLLNLTPALNVESDAHAAVAPFVESHATGGGGAMEADEDEDHFDVDEDGGSFDVALEPFVHQVGGHSALFLMDDNTVCKPLIPRELRFYQEAPEELRLYLADFKGQIQVISETDPDGSPQFVVRNAPPSVLSAGGRSSNHHHYHQRFRAPSLDQKAALPRFRHGSGSSTGEDFIAEDFVDEDEAESDENSTASEETSVAAGSTSRKRPIAGRRPPKQRCGGPDQDLLFGGRESWSQKCQEKQLAKSKKDDPCLADFLLLENVCVKFKRPCILDLKMGTRQHGDDAPKEKMDRQMEKCASTTSKIIGVRACGMKVYQAEVDGYKTWNKYFGRGLSVDGFKTALHDFLFNGRRFLHELIPDILTQLRQLSQVVRSLDGFRFYSSSLLIMYEGAPTCGPSEESEQVAPPATSISSSGAGLTVDVKMIDFAHSSLPTSNASAVRHRGPDTGYLFGLDNLIRLLEELLSSTVPLTV